MCDPASTIADNLRRIRERIARAAESSGRTAEQVTLVAVTKYVAPELVRPLVAAGCRTVGESRPQELWRKADALADLSIHWHLVGHLQRNKVRRTLPLVSMIHSLDSLRLAEAIEQAASKQQRRVPVLLEVNVSGEEAKHGFAPDEMEHVVAQLPRFAHLEVRGLMCMAALEGGLETARRNFAALRSLRDRLQNVCPEGVRLKELSMGMSDDFEVAVAEGATIVRIGSALFEGVY